MKSGLFCSTLSIVLCACDVQRGESPQRSAKSDLHAEEDRLFEKKLRCAQIRGQFAKELEGAQVDEIFYSQKLNTCVATVQLAPSDKVLWFYIKDALTGRTLFMSGNIHGRTEAELNLTGRVDEFR